LTHNFLVKFYPCKNESKNLEQLPKIHTLVKLEETPDFSSFYFPQVWET